MQLSPKSERTARRAGGSQSQRPKRPREFSSVEHLSPEAVVAFVDGELVESAVHRARVHLVQCPSCREETRGQRGTAEWLRGSHLDEQVRAPRDLVARLAGIASMSPVVGPDLETVPTTHPEDFLDRVEVFLRSFRRIRGQSSGRQH